MVGVGRTPSGRTQKPANPAERMGEEGGGMLTADRINMKGGGNEWSRNRDQDNDADNEREGGNRRYPHKGRGS